MALAIMVSTFGCAKRSDPGRRARLLRHGAGWIIFPQHRTSQRDHVPAMGSGAAGLGCISSAAPHKAG